MDSENESPDSGTENIAQQTTECECGTERYTWEQCPECGEYGR
jgi:hypothetical protein